MKKTALFSALFLFSFLLPAQKAEHLPREINSECEEREPTFSAGGDTLFFWRRKCASNSLGTEDAGDIWYSKGYDGKDWSYAIHPGAPLNSIGQDFVWQCSPDGDTLWVNRVFADRREKDAGVAYHVRQKGGSWSKQRLHIQKDYKQKGNYADYLITPQRTLLVSNVGAETYGSSDLYVCFPINDTTWSSPQNLGEVINTVGDEDAPFLTPDGRFMYFNSNGHGGFGSHDIFVSERLDDSWLNWSQPKNLGYPINTTGYDFDFQMTPNGEWAWWGSDMNTFGGNDLFRLHLKDCALDIYPEGDFFSLCEGDSLLLQGGFTTGNILQWTWLKNGKPIAKTRDLNVKEEGIYQLIRQKETCRDTSPEIRIQVQKRPQASISANSPWICEGKTLKLSAQLSDTEVKMQWYRNGVALKGANQAEYLASLAGKYSLRLQSTQGECGGTSSDYQVQNLPSPLIYNPKTRLDVQPDTLANWYAISAALPEQDLEVKGLVDIGKGVALASIKDEKNGKTAILDVFDAQGKNILHQTQTLSGNKIALSHTADGFMYATNAGLHLFSPIFSEKKIELSVAEMLELNCDSRGNITALVRIEDSATVAGNVLQVGTRGALALCRLSPEGEYQWSRTISCDKWRHDIGRQLVSDAEGNLYILGGFDKIANFSQPILRASTSQDNYFLAKFAGDGELKWARKIMASSEKMHNADLQIDAAGYPNFVLNEKVYKYNPIGNPVWESNLVAPNTPKRFRIAPTAEGLFVLGITTDDEYFLYKMNQQNNENERIWVGKAGQKGLEPIISLNQADEPIFALHSKGRAHQGLDPKANEWQVLRYGLKTSEQENKPISICHGDSLTLFTKNMGVGVSYQWYKDKELIKGANSLQYTVKDQGFYSVSITQSGNCTLHSSLQEVEINCGNAPKPELVLNAVGKPKKLLGRRVVVQENATVENEKVLFKVWDHAAIDKDTISLNINGEWVLRQYQIVGKAKEIEVTLRKGENNYILLYAHNLGEIPPNTIAISIRDGKKEIPLKLESDLHKCGALNIRVE